MWWGWLEETRLARQENDQCSIITVTLQHSVKSKTIVVYESSNCFIPSHLWIWTSACSVANKVTVIHCIGSTLGLLPVFLPVTLPPYCPILLSSQHSQDDHKQTTALPIAIIPPHLKLWHPLRHLSVPFLTSDIEDIGNINIPGVNDTTSDSISYDHRWHSQN